MAGAKSQVELSDFPRDMQRASRSGESVEMGRDLIAYLRQYAREKPEVAALWCFGIGFILGWKLKPW
jgi:hypothetical protein